MSSRWYRTTRGLYQTLESTLIRLHLRDLDSSKL